MIPVVVTGIGLRCGLGSLEESWPRLLQQETAIRLAQPFDHISPYPLALIENQPISLTKLLHSTLEDSLNHAQLTLPLPNCGVVMGSSRSYQSHWEGFLQGDPLTHWGESLPYQGSRLVAQQIGTNSPVLAPMAACATGIWSIFQGWELIQQGYCQMAIAGAIETPITPLTLAGFEKMGTLATTGCYPFDKNREGLVLGEGSAIFVLETQASAQKRGVMPYGKILGFGLTCDADHISAPSLDAHYAAIAVKQCLHRSDLTPADIDMIHAHGTATRLNDQREAQLITQLFSPKTLVTSTKGATGHTLGASGAIGVAFSLMALKFQQCPPCVGLKEADFPLNYAISPQGSPIKSILCFSFGFGGQNAVIALTAAD